MNYWQNVLTNDVLPIVVKDRFWEYYLWKALTDEISPVGIHLAVFVEPYLTYILDGNKTVESRFGIRRHAPYGQVGSGDIILLKHSGGPIVGLCKVAEAWFYNLNPGSWKQLRKEFTNALCAQDPEFWKQREDASFATLMRLDCVTKIQPVNFQKSDRRGWVVLRSPIENTGVYIWNQ